MPSALILIADGTEEMEFTIAYDTLVRAGVDCISAAVAEVGSRGRGDVSAIKCSRGVQIIPDVFFDDLLTEEAAEHDVLVIPGGAQGAKTISENSKVQELVREYTTDQKKLVGMICAGTLTASTAGLPKQPITSHPSVKPQLETSFEYSEDPVVVSGNLITSRGPGTSFPFALKLVEILCGPEKRAEVQGPMVFPIGAI